MYHISRLTYTRHFLTILCQKSPKSALYKSNARYDTFLGVWPILAGAPPRARLVARIGGALCIFAAQSKRFL